LADPHSAASAYLRGLQNADGGFRPDAGKTMSSLRATSAAVRALKYLGGEIPDRPACAGFVRRCLDKDSGGLADVPGGRPDVTITAVGVLAAVELKLSADQYEGAALKYLVEHVEGFDDIRIAAAALEALGKRPPQADEWLRQIEKSRSHGGTWGEGSGAARATGGAAVAVLRLGGKPGPAERVLGVLNAGQRKDGGFGQGGAEASDLESTYRVMRAYHMLGAKPDARALRVFVARCHNADGGYGVTPGQPSSVAATYYAANVLRWLADG
jgi:hypothetical protein